ncbi:MAG TPA: exosortase system-associated protein, TIGR04073 family [Verrucomicrobiota bacterium]|nr:exosortase system-associated protein, TIGR04073 family [Verrucomicrobiota bacterium]
MRNELKMLCALIGAMIIIVGCAGPEKKLGRGITNVTEFARMGEIRRSVEQTALWEGTDSAYTTGFIRGFNRSVARTLIGAYEIVTFPFPSYGPIFTNTISPNPVYPDSYKPNLIEDQTFAPDTSLGFAGGDVAPFIPGSRFRVFDN